MFLWDGLVWVVLELGPAVVPCATTDGESGSSLKLELRVTTKSDFQKGFLLNEPLHKISLFHKLSCNLILDLLMHIILL